MNFTTLPSKTAYETTYNQLRPYSDSSGKHSREMFATSTINNELHHKTNNNSISTLLIMAEMDFA